MLIAITHSVINLTIEEKTMSSILTDLSNEVVGPVKETSLNEDQVLEMYLEHLKSLMIQMIDNGFLTVEN